MHRADDVRVNARPSSLAQPALRFIAPSIDIPVDIPTVNLDARATDPADFAGHAPAVGSADGSPATFAVDGDAPYTAMQVERSAAMIAGSPGPDYPAMLRASGVEGEATVRFIVDTLGRAEAGSLLVLSATHDAFAQAVRVALPRMRFLPAEAGGHRVRMLVQQSFAFAITR